MKILVAADMKEITGVTVESQVDSNEQSGGINNQPRKKSLLCLN